MTADDLQLVGERTRIDARQLEEIVDEDAEPARVLLQRAPGTPRAVASPSSIASSIARIDATGVRRSWLAATIELAACVEEALELGSHRVERAAELGELARAVRRRPHREVAACELARR